MTDDGKDQLALAKGFVRAPRLVIFDTTLDPSARLTYLAVLSFAFSGEEAWPSMATLVSLTGQSEKTIKRHLDALIARGVLSRRRIGLAKSNRYRLADPMTVYPQEDVQALQHILSRTQSPADDDPAERPRSTLATRRAAANLARDAAAELARNLERKMAETAALDAQWRERRRRVEQAQKKFDEQQQQRQQRLTGLRERPRPEDLPHESEKFLRELHSLPLYQQEDFAERYYLTTGVRITIRPPADGSETS